MDGATLWSIAAALYALDAICRVPDRGEVILRQSLSGPSATVLEPTFRIAGRALRIPNLLRPDAVEFRLIEDFRYARLNQVDRMVIDRMASNLRPIEMAACINAAAMFALIPLLTHWVALSWAVIAGLAVSYLTMLASWNYLWRVRFMLGVTGPILRREILHCILCPPNSINTARRLSYGRILRFDGRATLKTYARNEFDLYTGAME